MIAHGHPWHVGTLTKRIGANIRSLSLKGRPDSWQRLMTRLEADAYFEERDDDSQSMEQELAAWALEEFSRFDPDRQLGPISMLPEETDYIPTDAHPTSDDRFSARVLRARNRRRAKAYRYQPYSVPFEERADARGEELRRIRQTIEDHKRAKAEIERHNWINVATRMLNTQEWLRENRRLEAMTNKERREERREVEKARTQEAVRRQEIYTRSRALGRAERRRKDLEARKHDYKRFARQLGYDYVEVDGQPLVVIPTDRETADRER